MSAIRTLSFNNECSTCSSQRRNLRWISVNIDGNDDKSLVPDTVWSKYKFLFISRMTFSQYSDYWYVK